MLLKLHGNKSEEINIERNKKKNTKASPFYKFESIKQSHCSAPFHLDFHGIATNQNTFTGWLLDEYCKVGSSNASRFVTHLVYNHTQNDNFLNRSSSQL